MFGEGEEDAKCYKEMFDLTEFCDEEGDMDLAMENCEDEQIAMEEYYEN